MSDQTAKSSSALMAMHQRYEASTAEQGAIERAWTAAREAGSDEEHAFQRASLDATRETDALRLAILYQAPANQAEATILQFHIANTFDLMVSCEDQPKAEGDALPIAVDTLLDFMCRDLGPSLRRSGSRWRAKPPGAPTSAGIALAR